MKQTAATDRQPVGGSTGTTAGRLAGAFAPPARRFAAACLVLLGGGLAYQNAVAEVVLRTQVQKVETLLDTAGNVERRLTLAEGVQSGDELRYTISVSNDSGVLVTEGRVVVTNPVPEGTEYVPGSAGGTDCLIEFSGDGEAFVANEGDLVGQVGEEQPPAVRSIRWTLQRDLAPGASHDLFFHVRMAPEATL